MTGGEGGALLGGAAGEGAGVHVPAGSHGGGGLQPRLQGAAVQAAGPPRARLAPRLRPPRRLPRRRPQGLVTLLSPHFVLVIIPPVTHLSLLTVIAYAAEENL